MLFSIIACCTLVAVTSGQEEYQRGDVRLVNGSHLHDGTLQVYNAGEWRFVCDDNFNLAASTVVCRQLGYEPPPPQSPVCCQYVDPVVYWLDNVQCVGHEARISDCAHNGWGNHNCGAFEGVNVRCSFRDPCTPESCGTNGTFCQRINNNEYRCSLIVDPKEPPNYRITLQGAFTATNNQPITPACTLAYAAEMESSAAKMVPIINSRIGTSLCPGTTGFSVPLASTSVSSSAATGIVSLDFLLKGSRLVHFREFYQCANDISAFVQDHNNWEQPIIPPVVGCSPVAWFQNRFTEQNREWFC